MSRVRIVKALGTWRSMMGVYMHMTEKELMTAIEEEQDGKHRQEHLRRMANRLAQLRKERTQREILGG